MNDQNELIVHGALARQVADDQALTSLQSLASASLVPYYTKLHAYVKAYASCHSFFDRESHEVTASASYER